MADSDSTRLPVYRVVTLGRLALVDPNGEPEPSLSTRRRKLAVLVYLALRSVPVPRAVLLDLFWGDSDERRARKSLSDALSHLRRVLGPDLLVARSTDVAVVQAGLPAIDVIELQQAATAGRYDRVIELYTGPFLSGFFVPGSIAFEDWSSRERARCEELFVTACTHECERLLESEEWRRCADLAGRWLEVRPTSTDAALYLIRALAAPATREALVAARAACTRQVEVLARDYQLAPEAALETVAKELERSLQDPIPFPGPASVVDMTTSERLRSELIPALSGAGGVVLLCGGRSADRRRIADRSVTAVDGPRRVFHARPTGRHAYGAICDVLRDLPQAVGLSGVPDWALGELSRFVPDLRERWPALPEPTFDEHRIVEALVRTVTDLACEVPVLIRIDDLEGLDAASREALLAAAQRTAPGVAWLIGSDTSLELANAARISLGASAQPRRWPRAVAWVGTATAVAAALFIAVGSRRGPAPSEAPEASIAVLPFQQIGFGDTAYFAEGLTDEVINTISRAPGLRVAARSSSYSIRMADLSFPEVGQRLGVRYLLEGTVRRDGERLRVNVQLIDAASGFQRWSSNFEHDNEDVFAAQAAVSRAVIGELAPQVRAGGAVPAVIPTTSAAYLAYLRGRYYWNRRRPETLALAISSYDEAIRRDSLYSPAWSALAAVHVLQPWASRVSPHVAHPLALQLAERAITLDPSNGEAYAVRGFARMLYHYEWQEAEQDLRRAVALEPGNASAHLWLSMNLAFRGSSAEAIEVATRAVVLDPLSPTALANLSTAFASAGQYERALAVADSALLLEDRGGARDAAGNAAIGLRRYDIAIEHFSRSGGPGRPPRRPGPLGFALMMAGRNDEARAIADALTAQAASGAPVREQLAMLAAARGDGVGTAKWLMAAYEQREPGLMSLPIDPVWSEVRRHPAVREVLAKMNLSPANAATYMAGRSN